MLSGDKSKLKNTKKLLEESENRYKLLVESIYDYAIFMLDTDGYILSWNTGAEKIKGYKAEEIIGNHFSIFYTKQATDDGFPQYELKQALKEGRFEDEGWRVKNDGSTFWASVVITAMFKDGIHIGFSKITRDLSERVRNEELMKKNKELLRINTDLDNFIYTASHDLKSPISNLEGLLEMLSKHMGENADSREEKILNLMGSSVHRLKQTIADLTEITKIQRGLEEHVVEVRVPEIMQEVKKDLEHLIVKAQAEIHESFEVQVITFNRAGLKSILYNLLSNALKYRSPIRPAKIEVTTYTIDDHAVLAVKDNGLGLKKEQKAKLFTMFKRFHNHVEGTGLGLYIIKRAIENSGGWIEVDSEFDKGSEFMVHFNKR